MRVTSQVLRNMIEFPVYTNEKPEAPESVPLK
jgi:hypothetical protein